MLLEDPSLMPELIPPELIPPLHILFPALPRYNAR